MKPLTSAYQRYKARHIKAGLCVHCGRKPKSGLLSCQVCLKRTRLWQMTRHPLFCLECRKLIRPEERTGRSIHKKCVQKRIARMHRLTHRRAALAYQRRHRELGLCQRCPEKIFRGGLCRKHRSAALAYQERHRKMGLCIKCPRKGFKSSLCRKHYKMAQERYYERAAG